MRVGTDVSDPILIVTARAMLELIVQPSAVYMFLHPQPHSWLACLIRQVLRNSLAMLVGMFTSSAFIHYI